MIFTLQSKNESEFTHVVTFKVTFKDDNEMSNIMTPNCLLKFVSNHV